MTPAKTSDTQITAELGVLSVGDTVKIDLGTQIQGFAAVVAHTLVITEKPEEIVTGKNK